jgi:hypothetical protein
MMHHHLPRLLRHRLVSPAAASFSTSKRASARRTAKPPPAAEAGEGAAAWQREKVPSELPRPSAIPFQPRVANAVSLVGTVGAPVQMQRTPDGRFSAVSVLVQDRRVDFPKFW